MKYIDNQFQGAGINLEGVSLELMLLDWDRVTKNEVMNFATCFKNTKS